MEAAERATSPVAPPRTKKIYKKAKPVKTPEHLATVSDTRLSTSEPVSLSTIKKPKPPVPKDRPVQVKLERRISAPLRPLAPPRRPQSPASPSSPRSSSPRLNKSSPLTNKRGSNTTPRVKKTPKAAPETDTRSKSAQPEQKDSVHIVDSRISTQATVSDNIYRNVAPRKPGQSRVPQNQIKGHVISKSLDLSAQHSVNFSPLIRKKRLSTQRSAQVCPEPVNRKTSLELSTQHSLPVGEKEKLSRKKSKPRRPAPPPPDKIAHYQQREHFLLKTENVYSEIGPPAAQRSSGEYSYVDFRRVGHALPTSRSLTNMSKFPEEEGYVNHDYKGPNEHFKKPTSPGVNVRPVSVATTTTANSGSIYTSLTCVTIGDEEVYSLPLNCGLNRSNSFTHESEYSVPVVPQYSETDELYTALTPHTQDRDSVYQQVNQKS